ncbi:MAG TPA: tetratricopeptide repeat protein [Kofleriaceae bacterium]|nr:tetratricopeptide repeat protein [Kofleriaceae bacterium]
MTRLGALLVSVVAACAGGEKRERTTPKPASDGQGQDANDAGAGSAASTAGPTGGGAMPAGDTSSAESSTPQVTLPNYDPDPAQAHAQVEQHLQVARAALASPTPDGDTALREARLALQIDAASVDAAAMIAFSYYHKHLYDTAELVLDDLFKREAAKQNANVYYVYGLVYDHTNRPEQAVVSYKKAVELNPGHASALVDLGVHQLQNTQYAEALQTFERLVNQFGRGDTVTLTSLGSAYRGHAADYPAGSPDHDDNVRKAEAAYKRALHAGPSYGPAYYNLGLLYLDNDPFPGLPDNLLRLTTARSYFDQYKNMAGVDIKLYDDRMKDVTKAIKRAEKQQKKTKGAPAPPAPKAKGAGKHG